MKEKTRKRLFLWIRIVIAIAAIIYVIVMFDLPKAWEVMTNPYPNLFWVAMAFVAFLAFMGFITLRWYILSRARKHPYGFLYLYRSVLIHMLFNNVLPTTIGGDVYRVMDTGGHEGKGVAFSIVWTDRMIGFIAVFGFGFIVSIPYTIMSGVFTYFIIFAGMFAVSITLTLAFLSERLNKWISPWLSKIRIFKYPLGEKIAGAFMSITHYRKHKGALFTALPVSFCVQLSIVCIWFFLFLSLPRIAKKDLVEEEKHAEEIAQADFLRVAGIDSLIGGRTDSDQAMDENKISNGATLTDTSVVYKPKVIHFAVAMPVVNTTSMISVGGWGLREVTFVKVLSSFPLKVELSNVERENLKKRLEDKFLATALLFDALNLFFSLLGGLFLILRADSRKKKKTDS
ncbi:flippase-like domain-containing protein [candidate division WOR-3 bacterium]|nr:flippase-like domain-containing protein [candidate division WOR-3 bacterium]